MKEEDQLKRINYLILRFFNYDESKVEDWFNKKHLFFDKKPPSELIKSGKSKEVLKFLSSIMEDK